MPKLRARYLFQNEIITAGDLLVDAAAERRESEAVEFNTQIAAYVAETDALRAAGRPMTERTLAPPLNNPYEINRLDLVGNELTSFGALFTKIVVVLVLVAAFFGAILVNGLMRYG